MSKKETVKEFVAEFTSSIRREQGELKELSIKEQDKRISQLAENHIKEFFNKFIIGTVSDETNNDLINAYERARILIKEIVNKPTTT